MNSSKITKIQASIAWSHFLTHHIQPFWMIHTANSRKLRPIVNERGPISKKSKIMLSDRLTIFVNTLWKKAHPYVSKSALSCLSNNHHLIPTWFKVNYKNSKIYIGGLLGPEIQWKSTKSWKVMFKISGDVFFYRKDNPMGEHLATKGL